MIEDRNSREYDSAETEKIMEGMLEEAVKKMMKWKKADIIWEYILTWSFDELHEFVYPQPDAVAVQGEDGGVTYRSI